MKSKCIVLIFCWSISAFLTGCAYGTSKVELSHSPLAPVMQKRSGTILIHQFTDKRTRDRAYIGTKRDGFGMPVGKIIIKDNKPLDLTMTRFFAEALEHAGYDIIIEPAGSNSASNNHTNIGAVLRGDIKEFWSDPYPTGWHDISISLELSDKEDQQVIWKKSIIGKNMRVVWIGKKSELEEVIRQAMDNALNNAAAQFTTDDFFQHVK